MRRPLCGLPVQDGGTEEFLRRERNTATFLATVESKQTNFEGKGSAMTPIATADAGRSSISNQPLSADELRKMNAYWRAANEQLCRKKNCKH
jgi:hypothetical protein